MASFPLIRSARRRSRADRLVVHYRLSSIGARVQLLKGLLPSLGLLASLTLANGIFARFAPTRGQPPGISEEDLGRIRWRHVRDLARYVEQADPAILGRLDR